ncbi:hypothetical protein IQ270_24825 [Microcoleus sp. LEGE 07076]|uniref:hypothetical protein n=1 Tax=Microcoleus sp. LEGE 07076 TaxID=915322 RepID=UPI001881D522|nr:hypothetical protein [Microcoleus sp. LEGE 07076]MBE9187782.1 hypothetical protein [Microcoleus sp. LEGE 07076]
MLDINQRQLHVFRESSEDGYGSQMILLEDATAGLSAFSTCTFCARQMLQPGLATSEAIEKIGF